MLKERQIKLQTTPTIIYLNRILIILGIRSEAACILSSAVQSVLGH